jgi:hypothetical protein
MDTGNDSAGAPARRLPLPRWLVIAVSALLFLIVAGAVALKVAFPPEKLRAMVVPRVEQRLGRQVELASVRLKLFPRIAVRLDGLSVANAPGFAAQPMIELGALELDLRLWPLLRKEIELGQVRLVRPLIRYEVREDGTSNFEGLGPEKEQEALAGAETPSSAAAGALFVSDLQLSGGAVIYTDRRRQRGARLALEMQAAVQRAADGAKAMDSRGTIELKSIRTLSPALGADSVALADITIDYQLFADLQGDSVALGDLQIVVGQLPLSGAGSVHRLKGERLLDFRIESGDVDIASLLSSLPEALRAKLGSVDASGTARLSLQASGSLASEAGADIRGTLGLENVAAAHEAYGPLLAGGAGQLSFNPTSLSLPAFDAQLMGRPFHLELRVDDFQRLDARGAARGAVDLAKVAQLRGSETTPAGVASFDLAFAGPVREPGALRLTGPVRLTDVNYQSESLAVPAVISAATIRLTGDGISAEAIPVQLGGSDVTLSFNAPGMLGYALSKGAIESLPDAEFTVTSSRLDLSELMVEGDEIGYGALVSARLAGVQVDGRDPGELAAERYKLPPLPPVTARGQVRIDELLSPPNRVRNLSFRLRLRDGVLDVLNLSGRSYGGKLSGRMSLDLSSGQAPFPMTYDLQLEGANAAMLVQRWTRLGAPISGTTDFSIAGSAALDGTLLPTLDGLLANGTARFHEGRFENFVLTDALAQRLHLDARKLSGYQDFGGGFEIKDGKFLVQQWQLLSGDFSGSLGGSAGLGGSLDLALDLDVPVATLQKAGLAQGGLADLLGQLAGSDQTLDVAVGIGGTMKSPVLQLDDEAIQQQLSNLLQGQGRDLLQRLFKPPPD